MNGLVIVHYNDYESLKHLIDNVKDYSILDKILIVDNNSNSDVLNKVRLLTNDRVELIENKDNKGFSYAINVGSRRCKELHIDNIIISNSDVIIRKEEDLSTLINYLDNEDVGVVAPVVEEFGTLNRGWKCPSPLLEAAMNIVFIHKFIRKKKLFYRDDYYKSDISYVDVASGCFFLMKSKTLEEINYLDENVFLYYEENILHKKLKKIGKKFIIVNNVHIIHNHSVTINKNINRLNKYKMQKKSQYYFNKYYNDANIFERFLLKSTAFISRNILRIVYLIKK